MFTKSYEQMSVEIIRMTGAELKRVRERAGVPEDQIKKRLNCSPASYYNYIKAVNDPIPESVEAAIDKDLDLSRAKNEILNPQSNQIQAVTMALERYGDLAGSVSKTLDIVSALLTKQETKYDVLARNNSALLDFLEIAKKEGEFHYSKK